MSKQTKHNSLKTKKIDYHCQKKKQLVQKYLQQTKIYNILILSRKQKNGEITINFNQFQARYIKLLEDYQNKIKNIPDIIKFSDNSVIFWACVGYDYKSDLYICPYKMNAQDYRNILKQWNDHFNEGYSKQYSDRTARQLKGLKFLCRIKLNAILQNKIINTQLAQAQEKHQNGHQIVGIQIHYNQFIVNQKQVLIQVIYIYVKVQYKKHKEYGKTYQQLLQINMFQR